MAIGQQFQGGNRPVFGSGAGAKRRVAKSPRRATKPKAAKRRSARKKRT